MVKTEVCNDSIPVIKKERPRPRKRKRDRSPSISAEKNDQSTSNEAITVSDTEITPIASDRQTTASSSDAQNSMLPPCVSISVSVSPVLSSVAIESAVMSPPLSINDVLESDVVLPVVPSSEASRALLESPSPVPLTPLPVDNLLSNTAQLSADNDTLSAAHSLFSLAQPVNGKMSQPYCCTVMPWFNNFRCDKPCFSLLRHQ